METCQLLLNEKKQVNAEIRKEINENENTPYPNLWNTIKAILRNKFIELSFHI